MKPSDWTFISDEQEVAFAATQRYQCLSGGYGSGKTLVLCMKLLYLALTFANYRVAVVRKELKILKQTTMQSFLKIAEPFIASQNLTDGIITLHNGSTFLFLGLDRFSEQDVKSLELDAALIDQGEEIDELIFTHLDTRIGRWDKAEVPEEFLKADPNWPRNPFTNRPLVPTYLLIACNPDTEYHWIYRNFHPQSKHWQEKNHDTHFFINMPSTSNKALSPEVVNALLNKDPEFVRRYVMGDWGFSDAQIHRIPEESILDVGNDFITNFKKKALLYRTYDHGESSPSCCLWSGCSQGIHIIFQEYYMPGKLVSYHRQAIHDLSKGETYIGNYADPEIFRKKAQAQGGRYCIADEYTNLVITKAPAIFWSRADNDELGTRNAINELFQRDPFTKHPVTGQLGAPRIYFCKKNQENLNGCDVLLREIGAQRREKLGEVDGKTVWSQDRDKNVPDHSYDPFRYYVAIHTNHSTKDVVKVPPNSFQGILQKERRSLLSGIGRF